MWGRYNLTRYIIYIYTYRCSELIWMVIPPFTLGLLVLGHIIIILEYTTWCYYVTTCAKQFRWYILLFRVYSVYWNNINNNETPAVQTWQTNASVAFRFQSARCRTDTARWRFHQSLMPVATAFLHRRRGMLTTQSLTNSPWQSGMILWIRSKI